MNASPAAARVRWQVRVHGVVQGVGFRPFVHGLASGLGLAGRVYNTAAGVILEVEGEPSRLEIFLLRLRSEAPVPAHVADIGVEPIAALGQDGFVIESSVLEGPVAAAVPADLATCPDCLAELTDPHDRRHRYPFINCSHCGPRFSLIESLPYDRQRSTMREFTLCPDCTAEYTDPGNRRYHAQPNACPDCGPQLAFWDLAGQTRARGEAALQAAAGSIASRAIVAVKGLGGFHLLADAADQAVIERLRRRKVRPHKPFALMCPDLATVAELCELNPAAEELLTSSAAPIVLLSKRRTVAPMVAAAVAPDNPCLGIMLPYTPLHKLLLAAVGRALVVTSGNRGGEPLCTDETEALEGLAGIADCFLVHDRAIVRPLEDAVVVPAKPAPVLLRAARGYAPLTLTLPWHSPVPVLALGGHLKSTVALLCEDRAVLSQPLGDLGSAAATVKFERNLAGLETLYRFTPGRLACDRHPDYHSSRYGQARARRDRLTLVGVQHHHAHVAAVMAEHGLSGPVLGVAWDGNGLGDDGTLWGGEFLGCTLADYQRQGWLRPLALPGGEVALREPRRVALGLLREAGRGEAESATRQAFGGAECELLEQMLAKGVNCPTTSSVGRLFDAIASLLGLVQVASFEGQAAMAVQFAAEGVPERERLPFGLQRRRQGLQLDWGPLVSAVLTAWSDGCSVPRIAAAFHHTLAAMILTVARRLGYRQVVLAGGCFQNRLLLELAIDTLQMAGFEVFWPQRLPANDAALALGQAVVAAHSGG